MYVLPRPAITPAKVTVVVNTYPKYHQYLQLALASIDYAHAAVIVVNDSMTTPIAVTGANVTVINRTTPERWGTGTARNIGWQNCTTDIVIYLDGDDLFFPGAIEAMVWQYETLLARTGVPHVVYGNLIRTDMNTVWVVKPQYRGTQLAQSPVNVANSVMPYLAVIPVRYLALVGGYVSDAVVPTWEEIVFEADLWQRGIRAVNMPIVTYIYRWSQTGRRGSNDTAAIRTTVQAFMYDRYHEFIMQRSK